MNVYECVVRGAGVVMVVGLALVFSHQFGWWGLLFSGSSGVVIGSLLGKVV